MRLEHASAEAARGAACELLFGIQEGSLPSKERLEELGEITQRRLNMEAAEAADQRVRIWSAMVPDEPLDSAVLNQSINGMRAWLREGSSQSKVVFELSTRRRLVIMMGLLLGLGLGVVAFISTRSCPGSSPMSLRSRCGRSLGSPGVQKIAMMVVSSPEGRSIRLESVRTDGTRDR